MTPIPTISPVFLRWFTEMREIHHTSYAAVIHQDPPVCKMCGVPMFVGIMPKSFCTECQRGLTVKNSDRELLKLAAKAAGINIVDGWKSDYETYVRGHPDNGKEGFLIESGIGFCIWNPLAYDGDALRLAVRLGMNVEINDNYVLACTHGNFSEPANPDPCAAARRAIVRAAAAVGSDGETV